MPVWKFCAVCGSQLLNRNNGEEKTKSLISHPSRQKFVKDNSPKSKKKNQHVKKKSYNLDKKPVEKHISYNQKSADTAEIIYSILELQNSKNIELFYNELDKDQFSINKNNTSRKLQYPNKKQSTKLVPINYLDEIPSISTQYKEYVEYMKRNEGSLEDISSTRSNASESADIMDEDQSNEFTSVYWGELNPQNTDSYVPMLWTDKIYRMDVEDEVEVPPKLTFDTSQISLESPPDLPELLKAYKTATKTLSVKLRHIRHIPKLEYHKSFHLAIHIWNELILLLKQTDRTDERLQETLHRFSCYSAAVTAQKSLLEAEAIEGAADIQRKLESRSDDSSSFVMEGSRASSRAGSRASSRGQTPQAQAKSQLSLRHQTKNRYHSFLPLISHSNSSSRSVSSGFMRKDQMNVLVEGRASAVDMNEEYLDLEGKMAMLGETSEHYRQEAIEIRRESRSAELTMEKKYKILHDSHVRVIEDSKASIESLERHANRHAAVVMQRLFRRWRRHKNHHHSH
eukprot:gene1903-3682_t